MLRNKELKAKSTMGMVSVILLLLSSLLPGVSLGETINLLDCSQGSVQTAINDSQVGDVIQLPTKSCSWSASVTIDSSKALTLSGNGATISGSINIKQHPSKITRITGFNFTSARAIYVDGSKTSAPYRIDNNVFKSNTGGITFIEVSGNGPGVIDHNKMFAPTNSEMIHNMGMGPSDSSGWSDDIVPGSGDAVYIESNEFTNNDVSGNPAYFWGNSAIQSYYGARTVFRYNQLNMSQVDQHGTPGMIGARWWEIYENTFNVFEFGNQDKYIGVRGGSGVIFNNHKKGYSNQGGGAIVLVEEDSGYPALYQIGRGKNQMLDPAYVWGNDLSMPVGSGSSNVVVNRDYYLIPKLNYTPYTYPHPATLPVPGGKIIKSQSAKITVR